MREETHKPQFHSESSESSLQFCARLRFTVLIKKSFTMTTRWYLNRRPRRLDQVSRRLEEQSCAGAGDVALSTRDQITESADPTSQWSLELAATGNGTWQTSEAYSSDAISTPWILHADESVSAVKEYTTKKALEQTIDRSLCKRRPTAFPHARRVEFAVRLRCQDGGPCTMMGCDWGQGDEVIFL